MAISHQENGTQNICLESCHTENCKQSIRRKLKELQKPAYAEKHGQKPPSSVKHLNGTSTPYNNTGTNNRTILAMSQEYEGAILSSETTSAMWKHQIQCVPFWVHLMLNSWSGWQHCFTYLGKTAADSCCCMLEKL
jgi:hypothetical protein